ncbi:hypothetical protein KM043_006905 [Ampulex compressa]|nr:hypothetical protein KM043_006905 [Ampulex compressa]
MRFNNICAFNEQVGATGAEARPVERAQGEERKNQAARGEGQGAPFAGAPAAAEKYSRKKAQRWLAEACRLTGTSGWRSFSLIAPNQPRRKKSGPRNCAPLATRRGKPLRCVGARREMSAR